MRKVALVVLIAGVALAGSCTSKKPKGPAPEAYIKKCWIIAGEMKDPTGYCKCLWKQGVQDPNDIIMRPAAQALANKCGGLPTF